MCLEVCFVFGTKHLSQNGPGPSAGRHLLQSLAEALNALIREEAVYLNNDKHVINAYPEHEEWNHGLHFGGVKAEE